MENKKKERISQKLFLN